MTLLQEQCLRYNAEELLKYSDVVDNRSITVNPTDASTYIPVL